MVTAAQAPGNQAMGAAAPSPIPKPGTVSALGAYAAPDAGTQFVNTLKLAAMQGQQPSNYQTMFQSALDQARSGINAQLGAALGDIQKNRQYAGEALGQLPGQISQDYGQALGTMGAADNTISALAAKAGLNGRAPGEIGTNGQAPSLSAYMAPVTAGVKGSEAAAQANVPLLGIGIQQAAAQQAAAAQMGAQGDMNQLQQQQMQFAEQQAAAQAAAQQQQASGLQSYLYSKQLQDDPNRNFGPSAAAGTSPVVDPKTGMPLGYTASDLQKAQATPQYQRASKLIENAQGITDAKTSAATQARVWYELQQLYGKQPALLAALQQKFPNGQPPPAVGPVQPAKVQLNLRPQDFMGFDLPDNKSRY